jgi:hypothetical protein
MHTILLELPAEDNPFPPPLHKCWMIERYFPQSVVLVLSAI